jgi:chromosomal replication initiation ATPase DnaA
LLGPLIAMPWQLPLDLPHSGEHGRATFLTGEANAAALALVDRWPDWPGNAALIWGPEGTGKTHLAEIWRHRSGAAIVAAADLAAALNAEILTPHGLVVEAVDGPGVDASALFHCLNLARQGHGSLLLTSRTSGASLPFALPDLSSRIRALASAGLSEPDEDLLRRVLAKLFADRQLNADPQVLEFLLRRMERSLASANALVRELDRASLAEGKPITRPFAAAVLGDRLAAESSGGQGNLFNVNSQDDISK